MLELVKERALFSKLNNAVTVKMKQTLWEDIAVVLGKDANDVCV